eukprot:scaffold50939_cov58-Phaeocystis_antarctica.AAC.2
MPSTTVPTSASSRSRTCPYSSRSSTGRCSRPPRCSGSTTTTRRCGTASHRCSPRAARAGAGYARRHARSRARRRWQAAGAAKRPWRCERVACAVADTPNFDCGLIVRCYPLI